MAGVENRPDKSPAFAQAIDRLAHFIIHQGIPHRVVAAIPSANIVRQENFIQPIRLGRVSRHGLTGTMAGKVQIDKVTRTDLSGQPLEGVHNGGVGRQARCTLHAIRQDLNVLGGEFPLQ